jgi:hypothetical protein
MGTLDEIKLKDIKNSFDLFTGNWVSLIPQGIEIDLEFVELAMKEIYGWAEHTINKPGWVIITFFQ